MTPDLYTIKRVDGVEPFNGYLWPTESWWLNHENSRFDPRWNFGIVELADGRFAIEGFAWKIEANPEGIVFQTRTVAIRTAAARLIRTMRASRNWPYSFGGMKGSKLGEAINWVLEVVARETLKAQTRIVKIQDEPMPVLTGWEGTDLFYAVKKVGVQ
jgi:hypothetical protein